MSRRKILKQCKKTPTYAGAYRETEKGVGARLGGGANIEKNKLFFVKTWTKCPKRGGGRLVAPPHLSAYAHTDTSTRIHLTEILVQYCKFFARLFNWDKHFHCLHSCELVFEVTSFVFIWPFFECGTSLYQTKSPSSSLGVFMCLFITAGASQLLIFFFR